MSETYSGPTLALYPDEVTQSTQTGEPFEAVVDAVDQAAELSEGGAAELWLLALSMSPGIHAAQADWKAQAAEGDGPRPA